VVWVTPAGAQNGRAQGIGVHFNNDESGQEARRKIEGLLGGVMQSTRPTHTL
jgi:type IV pilus assembly protein PilZ